MYMSSGCWWPPCPHLRSLWHQCIGKRYSCVCGTFLLSVDSFSIPPLSFSLFPQSVYVLYMPINIPFVIIGRFELWASHRININFFSFILLLLLFLPSRCNLFEHNSRFCIKDDVDEREENVQNTMYSLRHIDVECREMSKTVQPSNTQWSILFFPISNHDTFFIQ